MTGKQLKEWAATVPDEAILSVKYGRTYSSWEESFQLRAVLTKTLEDKEAQDDTGAN